MRLPSSEGAGPGGPPGTWTAPRAPQPGTPDGVVSHLRASQRPPDVWASPHPPKVLPDSGPSPPTPPPKCWEVSRGRPLSVPDTDRCCSHLVSFTSSGITCTCSMHVTRWPPVPTYPQTWVCNIHLYVNIYIYIHTSLNKNGLVLFGGFFLIAGRFSSWCARPPWLCRPLGDVDGAPGDFVLPCRPAWASGHSGACEGTTDH